MKYAIFDLDGTLADSMPYWKQLYLEYLKQRGVASPPLDTMIQASPMTAREAAAFFAQTFGLSDTPDQAVVEFNRLMEEHYRGDVQLKPGVPEFLRALQAAGVTMCVASATAGPLVETCLECLGIRTYFSFFLSCVEVGVGKKHPDVYLEAARRMGATPEETFVFEDAIYAARTAKRAGFLLAGVCDSAAEDMQEELKALSDCYITRWDDPALPKRLGI